MYIRDYSRRLFCSIKWCGLRCNASCLYSSTDNGLFTHFMPSKYYHFAFFRLSTYLYVLFVYVSVCVSIQLEIHSPENTNKITDVRALHVLHFILYSAFTATLYDRKICML